MEEEVNQQEETQTVGTILRNARLKKGKTVADVADELCIRKVYINAIENMDYTNIPPLPYGIGFIRSYANYLGLNSDRVVASYRQSFLAKSENHQSEETGNVETSTPHFKHVFFGLCGLAALFIAWSVLPMSEPVEEYRDDSTSFVPEPVIVEDDADEVSRAEIRAEDEKDGVTQAETTDGEEGETSGEAAEQSAENAAETTEDSAAKATDDSANAEAKSDEQAAIIEAPRMKLVLSGPSWIELKQGDNVLIRGDIYNKGYEYEIPNETGMKITVGRPRNVSFYLDGKPIKVVSVMKRTKVSLDEFLQKQN